MNEQQKLEYDEEAMKRIARLIRAKFTQIPTDSYMNIARDVIAVAEPIITAKARKGYVPVDQAADCITAMTKMKQQLATMYTLDEIKKALHDGWISRCGGYKNLPELLADVADRLTAKPKQERVTVEYVSASATFGWKVFVDQNENGLFTCKQDAERYANALRAEEVA